MGADIHMVVERQLGDRWIAVRVIDRLTHTTEPQRHNFYWACPAAKERNYKRFAALAGVRGDGPPARGLPEDVSDTARFLFETCGDHTPSWLPLEEACRIFRDTELFPVPARDLEYPDSFYFSIEPELDGPLSLHRLVFWFDS